MTTLTQDQVREGDKLRVTYPYGDTTVIREGVVTGKSYSAWRTAEGKPLGTDQEYAVIELLDRPKPPIELPTGDFAVVTYTRGNYTKRHAVLSPNGEWKCYDTDGDYADTQSPESLAGLLNGPKVSEAKVIFKGVSKL